MFSIGAQTALLTEALAGSVIHCQVKATSSAVNGSPSLQTMPSGMVRVTLSRSSANCPFSMVGTSVARIGIRVPSGI
jgi:hypothetical protein